MQTTADKAIRRPATKEQMWAGMSGGGTEILAKFMFPKTLEGRQQFADILRLVKSLPGRRWNPEVKGWTMPLSLEAYMKLEAAGFEMAKGLKRWYDKITVQVEYGEELAIPGLREELYPFQRAGVAFIESRSGRGLIADEMGLGKTAQALAWVHLNRETALPAIAVVPAGVKLNWARECKKWTDIPSTVLFGRPNGDVEIMAEAGGTNTLTILNYDILANRSEKVKSKDGSKMTEAEIPNTGWVDILARTGAKTLIIDEVHYVKNSKAKRTKALKKLAKKFDNVICLSGTPIVNRPVEFFNCLQILRKDLFPSFWNYAKKYCGMKHTGFGWDFTGATNTKELHELLTNTVMVRREKADVLTELPDKMRSVIPLEITNRKKYNKAERNLIQWIREEEGEEQAVKAKAAEALVKFEKLKQLAAEGKMAAMYKWIQDYLDTTDEKLVVFATHHKVIDALVDHFITEVGVVKLDGRDSARGKQDAVDNFQEDPAIRLLVGNIKAAGVGITLTAANATCFVELGWTPGDHDQAEDRVHRIGQEADSVTAYYLLAERTVEEEIALLLDEKREVLEAVLNGRDVEEASMLTELMRRLRERDEKDN